METRDSQQSNINPSWVAEISQPLPITRRLFNSGMTVLAVTLASLSLIPLFSIIWEILYRGISGLKPEMFVKEVIDNGFANAIVGTLIMVGIASAISIPCGVMGGIYLSEFGRGTKLGSAIRFIITVLTGVPSIVVGVFVYGVLVFTTKTYTGFAGGFALAVIMLPIITLTTEEALKLIPIPQRLASAALGGNKFQTTFKVVISAAIPGITTGVLLAVARAAGETAPLLFTASSSYFWSDVFSGPTASLPVIIYNLYTDSDPAKNALVWTASIILVGMVLFFSLLSRFFTNKKRTN
jgi:phosphate transport system permease protein